MQKSRDLSISLAKLLGKYIINTPPSAKNGYGNLEWIDTTKSITMILVIIGHCTYYNIISDYGGINYIANGDNISITHKLLSLIVGFIYSFHMPLFMFVSGMCFSIGRDKRPSFAPFVVNKYKRLIIPFALTTTFLSVPIKLLSGYYSQSENILEDIILGQYLLMGNSHLWFVVALFGIFMLAYFIEQRKMQAHTFFWVLLLIISWIGLWHKIPSVLSIKAVLRYLIFFMSGYVLFDIANRTIIKKKYMLLSWITFGLVWLVYNRIYGSGLLPSVYRKFMCFPSYSVFAFWGIFNMVFTCRLISNNKSIMDNQLYQYMKNNSYQLYLFSDPFNYAIIGIIVGLIGQIWESDLLSFLSFTLRAVGTFILAFVIISLLHKINKLRLCKQNTTI